MLMMSASGIPLQAQVPGPNVNMVSGTQWPGGDPFLQRQNEPSMAVSSRNPLHLLAGSNDYRTVDLPGVSGAVEPTGDAWLGLFKSFDGGQTWTSILVPGYPQDTSVAGRFSPLKGLGAAADPNVRAGTNGLFYYSGLAFNRQAGGASTVFVATFTDDNNVEGGDSIRYLWTIPVKASSGTTFEDKPSLAVDIPRASSGYCVVPSLPLQNTQIFHGGSVYVAWTEFAGNPDTSPASIKFSRSTDCGLTWSNPQQLSEPKTTFNQGASLAIDPNNGNLYIAWRVFATTSPVQSDTLMYVASLDGGNTFSKPALISNINPFDQGDTPVSFRTNAYPSLAVDAADHVYVAWPQRGAGLGGDARIMVATGTPNAIPRNNPIQWGAAIIVDPWSGRGHQIMPAAAFSAGKLTVAWYDLRNDDLLGDFTSLGGGLYSSTLVSDGGTPQFGTFIQDPPGPPYQPTDRRQTLDVRAAQALPGNPPSFFSSVQVSQYAFGSIPPSLDIQQLFINPPNLPMFLTGTTPFIGDYIDVAGPTFIAKPDGTWRYNNLSTDPDFTHVVWTDNRNVVPPADGNWANYTPPTYPGSTTSIFDPTQQRPACIVPGNTGDRNQDIYTAQLAPGLVVSAPGNNKALGLVGGKLIQREFPITIANTTGQTRFYLLTVVSQPPGGAATFLQFAVPGQPFPLTQAYVQVPPLSSTSRSIFVTSTSVHATVTVTVVEVTGLNGSVVPGGETGVVTINGDPNNPTTSTTTELHTAVISNPNIGNPNIGNPNIGNPNIGNPNIGNPNIGNPNIGNPNIGNTVIANTQIANPNIGNPNIGNTSLSDGTITDATWSITNTGNTTSGYVVNLAGQNPPPGVALQLVIYQNYSTPLAQGCALSVQPHFVPVANITSVSFATLQQLLQPAATNPTATALALAPGQTALFTLRAIDTTTNNPAQALQNYNPAAQASPVATSVGASTGSTQPIILTITTPLPQATLNVAYPPQTLTAMGGTGAISWSVAAGALPTGITLSTGGVLSGTPTGMPGPFAFVVQAKDTVGTTAQQPLTLVVNPPAPAITSPTSPFNTTSPLQVGGTSLSGAAITIFDNGVSVATPTAVGTSFSVSVPLLVGTGHSLTAKQTVNNVTSAASAAVTGTIVPPPPVIGSPSNGFSTTSPLQVSGTAITGATVTVYDGVTLVGTTTASANAFSVGVTLTVGTGHSLTATQTVNGATSAASVAVTGTILPPPPLIGPPSNGFSTTSPVQVNGTAITGATVTVYDGMTSVGTTTASANAFSVGVTLTVGTGHSLTATQTVNGATSGASAAVTGTILPGAPAITLPAANFSTTNPLQVSGTATTGATVTVYDGVTLVGTTTASANAFSVGVTLTVGTGHSLTAKQTVNSVTSAASAAIPGTILPPPPTIMSPSSGFSTTSPLLVSGTATTGANVTVYDGATSVGTTTASAGAFSVGVTLAVGTHTLTATQSVNGATSGASAPVTGTIVPTLVSIAVTPAGHDYGGDTVSVNYDFPSLGTVIYSGGSAVVSPGGTAFNTVATMGAGAGPTVTVSSTTIQATFANGWTFDTGASKTFDGLVITDASANIAGVSLASTNIPGFVASQVTFDSHNVYINFPYPPFATLAAGASVSVNVLFAGTIAGNGSQQYTATGTFSDSSMQILPNNSVTWASSATGVATINSTGLATGVSPGTTTISANSSGLVGSTTLTDIPVNLATAELNGSVFPFNAGLRMTSDTGQASAAWSPSSQPVANGFTTSFQFQITPFSGEDHADGFAFVIQGSPSGAHAIGVGGGAIGYGSSPDGTRPGISNSIAIEFDTYWNASDYGDTNNNHIAIISDGTNPNKANHVTSALSATNNSLPFSLTDGHVHTVNITYSAGTLSVTVDGNQIVSTDVNGVNLATYLGLTDGTAYVGFTGGTGSVREDADIYNWSWSSN
jgi:hypothetical protein